MKKFLALLFIFSFALAINNVGFGMDGPPKTKTTVHVSKKLVTAPTLTQFAKAEIAPVKMVIEKRRQVSAINDLSKTGFKPLLKNYTAHRYKTYTIVSNKKVIKVEPRCRSSDI